jgi:hypothetical protein
MIIKRTKKFAWPALITGALNVLGIGSTVAGMGQAAKQSKEAEEQAAETQKRLDKQNELIRKQNKKIEKLREQNPGLANQVENMTQKSFAAIPMSVMRYLAKGRNMLRAAGNTEAGKVIRNIGSVGKATFGKDMVNNMKLGAAAAGTTYVTGKYIQRDMKKNNMDISEDGNLVTKSYAAVGSVLGGIKKVGKAAWKNKGTIATGAAIGGIPTVLGYTADKIAYKDQVAATQEQRQYSWLTGMAKGVKALKTNPGKTLSGFASWIGTMGMGGTKNVQRFGRHLETMGKTGVIGGKGKAINGVKSETTAKIGKWIQDNPAKANLVSIVPGAAVVSATWDGTQKAAEKVTKTVDPNAYKYINSKQQQVG